MTTKLADPGKGDSLESFLRNNQTTLSALGVFAALTVLSGEIHSQFFKEVLSSLWAFGLILTWFEVYYKLPREAGMRLFMFQYVLLWGGIFLVAYWLYEFRNVSNVILFLPTILLIIWFVAGSLSPILKRFKITRWLFGIGNEKKMIWQNILLIILSVSIIFFSIVSGIWISFGTNLFFDGVKKNGIIMFHTVF